MQATRGGPDSTNWATRQNVLPALAAALLLTACSGSDPEPPPVGGTVPAATPQAVCGAGARPETSYQGRVTQDDWDNGRVEQGFRCNIEMIGSYTVPGLLGTVGGYKVERYVDAAGHECAYYDTTLLFPSNVFGAEAGVNVMDLSDPTRPVRVDTLRTAAMLSPHESLVLNTKRGLLAAVLGSPLAYPGAVDIYDLSQDCRHPVLKATAPLAVLGHESGMSPDGYTLYSASPGTPTLTPIDISNPALPRPLTVIPISSHGLGISDDGNRAYVAGVGLKQLDNLGIPTDRGLVILDVSEVQARARNPRVREVARLHWDGISTPQAVIPVTIKGHPYLVEIDEFGAQSRVGAARIIDIGDETRPKIISDLRLEVHQPEHFAEQAADPGAGSTTLAGYAGHYCSVPRRQDPGIVACSMILSGLRVFDIRDPYRPREVAYFNAPVIERLITQPGNWAMSSPAFAPERREIWYTDANSGFYVLRLSPDAWPEP
ncbi:MAG: hypothetical protein Q8Q73_11475 [Stagnimonas sp.]|nr:hypothetical protein [Stagnimonas sp.]